MCCVFASLGAEVAEKSKQQSLKVHHLSEEMYTYLLAWSSAVSKGSEHEMINQQKEKGAPESLAKHCWEMMLSVPLKCKYSKTQSLQKPGIICFQGSLLYAYYHFVYDREVGRDCFCLCTAVRELN